MMFMSGKDQLFYYEWYTLKRVQFCILENSSKKPGGSSSAVTKVFALYMSQNKGIFYVEKAVCLLDERIMKHGL